MKIGPHIANVIGAGVKSLVRDSSTNTSSHDSDPLSITRVIAPAMNGASRFRI
jgi:hypothetical protein